MTGDPAISDTDAAQLRQAVAWSVHRRRRGNRVFGAANGCASGSVLAKAR